MKVNQKNRQSVSFFASQVLMEEVREGKITTKEAKKKIMKVFKKEFPTQVHRKPKTLINKFTHGEDDGESYTNIFIFKKESDTMEKIHRNMNIEGDRNCYDYSPTGLWFAQPADIKEFEERIVVIQTIILDC